MPVSRKYIGCFLCILLFITETHAQQPITSDTPTSVQWVRPGFEPLFINSGVYRNQGIGDLTIVELGKALPQYKHATLNANYIRALTEIRRGNNACMILHRSAEREKFIYFSNAVFFTPSYQIYILSSQRSKFSLASSEYNGGVGFETFLTNSREMRMAHSRGHSYGKTRDAIFKRHRNKLQISHGYSGQRALIKMLLAGRVDFFLEFPWVVNHHLRELKINPAKLYKIQLTDVPAFDPSYIGCPQTVWGRSLISEINKLSPPMHQRVRDFVLRWLTPQEVKQYQQAYSEYFDR